MCLTAGSKFASMMEDVDDAAATRFAPAADHHLHIQSAAVSAELRRVAATNPAVVAGLNPLLLEDRSGADALRELDAAGIDQGVLLSEAYMFASVFASGAQIGDRPALTRRENAFNVEAARASGGRLKAFVSVSPFADFAHDELDHWISAGGAHGVKLHLANSGFDPSNAAHIRAVAAVFAKVNHAGLPLLVHFRPSGDYGADAVARIVDEVLPHAPDVTIQLAHAGGGGGLDPVTVEVFAAFTSAIARRSPGTEQLVFDLAAVLVVDPHDAAAARRLNQFAGIARDVGLDRLLMGSDWPTLCSPRAHVGLLLAQFPFDDREWRTIAGNRASYLDS